MLYLHCKFNTTFVCWKRLKNVYAFPATPWHIPYPFLSNPLDQITSPHCTAVVK